MPISLALPLDTKAPSWPWTPSTDTSCMSYNYSKYRKQWRANRTGFQTESRFTAGALKTSATGRMNRFAKAGGLRSNWIKWTWKCSTVRRRYMCPVCLLTKFCACGGGTPPCRSTTPVASQLPHPVPHPTDACQVTVGFNHDLCRSSLLSSALAAFAAFTSHNWGGDLHLISHKHLSSNAACKSIWRV